MTALIVRGDAGHLPLPSGSVDLVVTSPPYFALRSYTDNGEHYQGQIGSEPTPQAYIAALIDCTREWVRVLKPGGSIWVNLGDKYANQPPSLTSERVTGLAGGRSFRSSRDRTARNFGVRTKSLLLLPERYRIACVDELGLIARAVVVWSKPNGLPESVTDRVRRSHEDWVHLTKAPRYYSAVDAIRQRHVRGWIPGRNGNPMNPDRQDGGAMQAGPNPLGALPGSVWEIEEDLWDHVLSGPMRFCPRCGGDLAAGSGSATTTPTDTPPNTSPRSANGVPGDSSTKSSSGQSPRDSPLITSAETSAASIPSTSSPSPSKRTYGDGTRPTGDRTARTVTSSQPRTPTFAATGGESAACVCELGLPPTGLGSVWNVPTEPLTVPDHLGVDHFAAFPTEWPRRIILGWSPSGICTACGEGRQPVGERPGGSWHDHEADGQGHNQNGRDRKQRYLARVAAGQIARSTGEESCACGTARSAMGRTTTSSEIARGAVASPSLPLTRPAVVLDPFGGTGTTALVASVLGRHGISVDMSADYCRLAAWRTRDPGQRAKAMRVEKPAPQADGQAALFDVGV